jgi:hypothetical protein
MLKSMLAISAAAVVLGTLPVETRAANPGYCAHYADLAVWQYNRSRRGCYQGTNRRWHGNYDVHYGWCLGVPEGMARAEDSARGAQLHACFG